MKTIRGHKRLLAAARELARSDACIHVRFKRAGLTIQDVLAAPDLEDLLQF